MIRSRARAAGFTLIEVVIFMVVVAILMTTIVIGTNNALVNGPRLHENVVAAETAQRCMEFFLQSVRNSSNTPYGSCGQSLSSSQCTTPSGYSVSAYLGCASWAGDGDYQTITVTVTGAGNAVLSVQYASYLA